MTPLTPQQIIARMREEGRKIQQPEMTRADKARRLRIRRRIEMIESERCL